MPYWVLATGLNSDSSLGDIRVGCLYSLLVSSPVAYLSMGTIVPYLDTAQQTWVEQWPKKGWTTDRAGVGRGPVYPESTEVRR